MQKIETQRRFGVVVTNPPYGERLSDEAGIVSAASITFERCIRHIPPSRKDKDAVCRYLLRLAEEVTRLIA